MGFAPPPLFWKIFSLYTLNISYILGILSLVVYRDCNTLKFSCLPFLTIVYYLSHLNIGMQWRLSNSNIICISLFVRFPNMHDMPDTFTLSCSQTFHFHTLTLFILKNCFYRHFFKFLYFTNFANFFHLKLSRKCVIPPIQQPTNVFVLKNHVITIFWLSIYSRPLSIW